MKTAIIMQSSWKEYLLRQARLHSMCTENLEGLRACETKADAVALYKKTIDWALEKNYPPVNFIINYNRTTLCPAAFNSLFIIACPKPSVSNDSE